MSKSPSSTTTNNNNNHHHLNNNNVDATPSSSTSTPPTFKLRKIPPIPIRRSLNTDTPDSLSSFSDHHHSDDAEAEVDEDFIDRVVKEATSPSASSSAASSPSDDESSSKILLASSLGLNHIRTRSVPSPSPLRFSSTSPLKTSCLGNNFLVDKGCEAHVKARLGLPPHNNPSSIDQGRKVSWNQTKSLRYLSPLNPAMESHHASFVKDLQSPRFQTILRITSGRKKKTPDVKSFSHELNSKGVRPYPVWKSRAFGHMEEFLVAIRTKFDRLKEEVDADLGIFAGDLVGILEKTSDSHPEWRESLEDLLVIARYCAKMSANEFWQQCEGIVQNLDDRRQELPMGILKQAHTRLLFILTRCSRLVQFQKENGYEEDSIVGLHQLSDLGVYPEKILEIAQQDFSGPLFGGKPQGERQRRKSHVQEQESSVSNEDQVHQHAEVNTAKSDSTASSYKMSSWKKLPSAAEKNRKDTDSVDTPPKKSEPQENKEERRAGGDDNSEIPYTPEHPPSAESRKVSWAFLGEQHNVTYDDSMICRICEVEIPVVHVEEHSLICTIADRCDLKGLTVNERLNRVAETLEKILDSWTPKSTPRSCDTPKGTAEVGRLSTSGTQEELDELSPKENGFSRRNSEDILDVVSDCENAILTEDLNALPNISCETQSSLTVPDADSKTSSGGSLTPRSPLLTPRTSQIELLLSGRRTITELENYQQVSKLLEIAHSIALINGTEYSALECMLDRLEELKYAIQDRKVDALIVETFGRRIEKLLQEKYVHLCAQIDDERLDSSNHAADEDSSMEDDTVRSLRASPIGSFSKDRTSIEDFEIIKPISRGAFGRVFLARKRRTGDLFAIKVLKKADMIRKNAVESILAERNILISVRNPFVVRFFYSFTCRENLYLVMEYLNGGDLYSLLRNLGCLDEDMARIYIAEVVLALELLHSLNVIHRDLKPDNLLIGQDGHLKLTDFGLSKVGLINSTEDLAGPSVSSSEFLSDDEAKNQHSSKEQRQKHSVAGTPDYLAPEILLGMGHGAPADWWSLGVILFELLVGIPPFNAETPQQIFDNIMNRDIPWPKVPEELSYEARDLINKLLTENPVQRLGATGAGEVKKHPFFVKINWDTLARQKAMFIPSAEPHETSYFMSRYIWNPEDENVHGGSDFDDLTDTCSSSSFTNSLDDDGDECGSLADFSAPTLAVKYSFSNFSFKNLSQLASINYDLVVKSAKEGGDASKPAAP